VEQRQQTEVKLIVLLGIIQQLMTTRQGKLFSNNSVNPSQFAVLNHFTHTPDRSWTVTELADVMEMNQPGITKIVSVLMEKNLLKARPDDQDKRKRHLMITAQGMQLCSDTFISLMPDVSHAFASWDNPDLDQFKGYLEKLMGWLDNHRDDIRMPSTNP